MIALPLSVPADLMSQEGGRMRYGKALLVNKKLNRLRPFGKSLKRKGLRVF